jgi:hypothetical protein
MTIAIGTLFNNGAVVCADTKVVASDGATTMDNKVFASLSPKGRMFLIADAAEDANAAKMLGGEISSAICDAKHPYNLGSVIKPVMTAWHSSYHHFQPPNLQFLIASVVVGDKRGQVFVCEPPSTVAYGWPIAIGRGARVVEPRLLILSSYPKESLDAKSVLLRLAYLMYLAKKDEGSACGGDTNTFVISTMGSIAWIEQKEMKEAENLAEEMDSFLVGTIDKVIGHSQEYFGQKLSDTLAAVSEKYKKFEFPSLKMLETIVMPKKEGTK